MMQNYTQQNKGALLVLVLVFGSIFFVMLVSLMNYMLTQSQVLNAKYQGEKALSIAEAGLNYYKWYLAHNPDDTTNGTGVAGPYVIPYEDPEDGLIGEFSLDIASSSFCGQTASIDIYSTGATYDAPSTTKTVYARYARPTVAEYAYIINSNVWAGADRVIIGPYHSNGGIRMDGTNNSTVTSQQETWTCTSSFGCTGDETKDGVFGAGPNSGLWTFPATPINFTGLTVDLATMYDRAKNGGGIYISNSGKSGYRIVFQPDGTFNLYLVKSKQNEPNGNAYGYRLNMIKSAQYQGNYTIPASCPLIFVEDDVWLSGDLSGKVSVAAADIDTVGVDPTMILDDNITYATTGSGLLAIAEFDVLVGFNVPNDMELNGIFIAQTGHFGRNYYDEADLPTAWDKYVKRNSLTMNGTIVSNGRVGTKWTCGGVYCSGFNTRYNSYDRNLVNDPPPLAPRTSDDFKFIEWRQQD